MEVWWILENGSVQGAKWNEGQQWQQYELAPAGSAEHLNKAITALSINRDTLEVWWIGKDGSVQGAKWNEGQQWQRYELAPAGSTNSWGRITAVSKFSGSMDVFWVGLNSSVQGATWVDNNWKKYELAPERSTYGPITAVSRIPGSMDLFWIGNDHSVKGAKWEDGAQWQLYQVYSSDISKAKKSISTVSTNSWTINVCWISESTVTGSNSIYSAKWEENGEWQTGLLTYGDDDFYPEVITILSRQQDALEVWWTDVHSSINGHGQNEDYQIAPYGSADRDSITAVSMFPGTIDVMWIGTNGSVQGAKWTEERQWQRYEIVPPPTPLLPTGEQRIDISLEPIDGNIGARILKMTGSGFQANEPIKIFVSVYVNMKKVRVDTLNTQANTTTGSFFTQQEVQCQLHNYTMFYVMAEGSISGKSNSLYVGC
ncbi:hypothetical protein [Bacillus thuringiensis]|uniref:hypothetical protein n=1 Tax=Bacillus thuringiensis TaxID=1428 RepID=UPI001157C727|nr:hypothetical protein [Bacillus thuringiensis]